MLTSPPRDHLVEILDRLTRGIAVVIVVLTAAIATVHSYRYAVRGAAPAMEARAR